MPAKELGEFVSALAHRIAKFPAAGHAVIKERVNAIELPTAEEIRRDSALVLEGVTKLEGQARVQAALKSGFQNRDAEVNLARLLGELQRKRMSKLEYDWLRALDKWNPCMPKTRLKLRTTAGL